jgi:hypothetical protein
LHKFRVELEDRKRIAVCERLVGLDALLAPLHDERGVEAALDLVEAPKIGRLALLKANTGELAPSIVASRRKTDVARLSSHLQPLQSEQKFGW